jgi:hypothetical protein
VSEHLIADGWVEVGGEEGSEKVVVRGRRRCRGPGDEAGDPPDVVVTYHRLVRSIGLL